MPADDVGTATAFASHTWKASFRDLVAALTHVLADTFRSFAIIAAALTADYSAVSASHADAVAALTVALPIVVMAALLFSTIVHVGAHHAEGTDKEGDAVIKVLDGDKSKVFAKGLNEPKGIAFTGKYLVTADQTRVMKIDRKGNVSVLADKKDFPREVSFLNDVAASHDRKSVYVTDMGAISKMFDPDKERTLWPRDS